MSTKTSQKLHIFFFPFMAHGHMIPTLDMAKLFVSRGCKTTIVTTPANQSFFNRAIESTTNLDSKIQILTIKFPSKEVGLPEGCENTHLLTTLDMMPKFFAATTMLEQPLEQLIKQHHPNCLVADIFFPWATKLAAKHAIPRLVFHGISFFALSASICLMKYQPHKKVFSDSEKFVVPNLPNNIILTRSELPDYLRQESELTSFAKEAEESELASYGVLVNSFYELEPAYVDHYRKFLGRKAWHIGPAYLSNRNKQDEVKRGPESSIEVQDCLNWLDTKKPNSVVYVSFGTVANFKDDQLMEIAKALEASGKEFIWVVKKGRKQEGVKEEWLPEGFEKRMEEKGLIIRGWAPQVLILEHEAIGGFVTHCGWNSILEGVCAGVAMVTWPVSEEQFYNDKFVTQVLGIGIGVGAQQWARLVGDSVKSEAIEKAVVRIMEGEEAEVMRKRAKGFKEMARRAFVEGGSSHSDLDGLIEELKLYSAA